MGALDSLPDDVDALKAMVVAAHVDAAKARAEAIHAQEEALRAQAEAARAQLSVSSAEAMIAHMKLAIEKLKRELYGSRSERTSKLIDQMELELEELEAARGEDEIAAAGAVRSAGADFHSRRQPVKKPFPEGLPRERVIVPGPSACPCCGSIKLSKIGEEITETLEVTPRRFKK